MLGFRVDKEDRLLYKFLSADITEFLLGWATMFGVISGIAILCGTALNAFFALFAVIWEIYTPVEGIISIFVSILVFSFTISVGFFLSDRYG